MVWSGEDDWENLLIWKLFDKHEREKTKGWKLDKDKDIGSIYIIGNDLIWRGQK